MLVSWTLIQFDGGKLDGVGDRPEGAPANRDYVIYIGAILAIPVAWFLFSNLMNSAAAGRGNGHRRLRRQPADHGQDHVRHVPIVRFPASLSGRS